MFRCRKVLFVYFLTSEVLHFIINGMISEDNAEIT